MVVLAKQLHNQAVEEGLLNDGFVSSFDVLRRYLLGSIIIQLYPGDVFLYKSMTNTSFTQTAPEVGEVLARNSLS